MPLSKKGRGRRRCNCIFFMEKQGQRKNCGQRWLRGMKMGKRREGGKVMGGRGKNLLLPPENKKGEGKGEGASTSGN